MRSRRPHRRDRPESHRSFEKKGYLDQDGTQVLNPKLDPLFGDNEAIREATVSSIAGKIAFGPNAGKYVTRIGSSFGYEEEIPLAKGRRCYAVHGFSLHANTSTNTYQRDRLGHYQHDVLNRVLDKSMSVTALPTSNQKLTTVVPGFKEHPFSWWEKKGIDLGVGTDNYITLGTNYIFKLLLLLLAEPEDLKITKLLMVATGETRRPYLSHLLWEMHKNLA